MKCLSRRAAAVLTPIVALTARRLRGPVCAARFLALLTFPAVAMAAPELASYEQLARNEDGRRLLAVARRAMISYADHGAITGDSLAARLDWPGPPAGVYLTLQRGGTTRACVGSSAPLRGGLVEAVQALAVEVLSADRRRPPVRREELDRLQITITFAGTPRPIQDPHLVNPAHEGLLVGSEHGHVAFLPGEARTVSWALREARRAGIAAGSRDGVRYQAFSAVLLKEASPIVDTEVADDQE